MKKTIKNIEAKAVKNINTVKGGSIGGVNNNGMDPQLKGGGF